LLVTIIFLLRLEDELNTKISDLNRTVQIIAKKTNVDMSSVKTDVDEIKGILVPWIKRTAKFFASLQEEEERRKKNGEGMIV
jgi:hypothetical protein